MARPAFVNWSTASMTTWTAKRGAGDVRQMHAVSLRARAKSCTCSCPAGWGPDLYVQKYGHPMLRRRHLPFAIGSKERDQWMHCMRKALRDMPIDQALREKLEQSFLATADHMRQSTQAHDGLATEDHRCRVSGYRRMHRHATRLPFDQKLSIPVIAACTFAALRRSSQLRYRLLKR